MFSSDYEMKLPRIATSMLTHYTVKRAFEDAGKKLTECESADIDNLTFGQFGDADLIGHTAPRTLRRAVETLARYFRREFQYDFVQYRADVHAKPNIEAFLWTVELDDARSRDRSLCIGACSFVQEDGWTLAWCWFHPYARRRGYLRGAWTSFRKRYGIFHIERPLSLAMRAFLEEVEPHLFETKSEPHSPSPSTSP